MKTTLNYWRNFSDKQKVYYMSHTIDRHNEGWFSDFKHNITHSISFFDVFVERAIRMRRQGRSRMGAKRIIEDIRWDTNIGVAGSAYKIKAIIAADLVRLVILIFPEELGGDFFKLAETQERAIRRAVIEMCQ